HRNPFPQVIRDVIRPVYEDFSSDELLQPCESRFTQNSNDSLNSVIWSIAPKTTFYVKNTIDIAAYTTDSIFNDGCNNILLTITSEYWIKHLQLV
ncbi:hypothetical protein WH47_08078, partial [Habropoda laboriosa]